LLILALLGAFPGLAIGGLLRDAVSPELPFERRDSAILWLGAVLGSVLLPIVVMAIGRLIRTMNNPPD
jgi:hypothetical protein